MNKASLFLTDGCAHDKKSYAVRKGVRPRLCHLARASWELTLWSEELQLTSRAKTGVLCPVPLPIKISLLQGGGFGRLQNRGDTCPLSGLP